MSEQPEVAACTHACSYGCGRKYDLVVVQVVDSSTLMLCIPCLLTFSHNVMRAMVGNTDPEVLEVMGLADMSNITLVDPDVPEFIMPDFSDPLPEDEFEYDGEEEEESTPSSI